MHTTLCRTIAASLIFSSAAYAVAAPLRVIPKRASIKLVPSRYDGLIIKTGNVEVVFKDGHKETWTHRGDCHSVRVSEEGAVGWIKIDKQHIVPKRIFPAGKDTMVVRRADGTTQEFAPFQRPPEDENWYIEDWRFADGGAAVILRSTGHHGPSSFVKYALASGKEVDSREGYTSYNQLPAWAKPLGDPQDD